MTTFVYQPLDLDRPAVRFIRLLAGYLIDPIRCEIIQGWVGDEDGMPYDALSYTWGSSEKAAKIEVGRRTMPVTKNLYLALQQLRLGGQDRILWVDAICIDQENKEEQRHQIQHMSSIYRKAECVLVWLGEGNEDTDFAMDMLKPLEELVPKVKGDWRFLAQHVLGLDVPFDRETTDARQVRLSLLKGMTEMLNLPWFRRIWILQEVANARVATILCGRRSVSAKVFAQVPSMLGLSEDHYQAVLDIMPGFSRTESWWNKDRSLFVLLSKFKSCQATDRRDMVYALLGISSDAQNNGNLLQYHGTHMEWVVRMTVSFLLLPGNQELPMLDFLNWDMSDLLGSLSEGIQGLRKKVLTLVPKEARYGSVRRLLLPEPNAVDSRCHTTLFFACSEGNKEVVDTLLTTDVEVDQKDVYGRTPLFFAVNNGYSDVTELLLQCGSDPNIRDINGETVLFFAVLKDDVDMTRLLLNHGADWNVKNNEGWTAPYIREHGLSHSRYGCISTRVLQAGELYSAECTAPLVSHDSTITPVNFRSGLRKLSRGEIAEREVLREHHKKSISQAFRSRRPTEIATLEARLPKRWAREQTPHPAIQSQRKTTRLETFFMKFQGLGRKRPKEMPNAL